MRLLRLNEKGDLSLTDDRYEILEPYAILSHTWGEDHDEVLFDDFERNLFENKAGYEKIRFCREQAQKDELQYFWVDTCCIQRANFTEYSEAITSMFRWYRDSAKCYVYLSDVSVSHEDQYSTPTWEPAFRKSRWFTRGWTLQELLAPKIVEFYSRDGRYLGDRNTLEQQIHEITKIPRAALQGTPLTDFSVEERMQWGQTRKTKRKEDEAYCLLGIFNVFLSPRYGEREEAFRRLERKIMKNMSQSHKAMDNWIRVKRYSPENLKIGRLSAVELSMDQRYSKLAVVQQHGEEAPPCEPPLLHSLVGHRKYVRCFTFSLDGKQLASGSSDCTIRLWDVATGLTSQEFEGHKALVEGVAFSPDGKRLASASEDGSVRLWDVAMGSTLQTLESEVRPDTTGYISPLDRVVYHVAFSPDGKRLASGQWNGMVKLWDVATGSALQTLANAHNNYVSDVAFSPDGKWLASASGEGIIKLWEAAGGLRGSAPRTLEGHDRFVRKVTFAPDSKRLASAGADGTVRVWDVETGTMLQMLRGSTDLRDSADLWHPIMDSSMRTMTVQAVAFSGDGKQLMSVSEAGTVRLWDVAGKAREVKKSTLRKHKGIHSAVAFSPDLRWLASTQGSALTIQLWDVREAKEKLERK
ncbi:hypothetical protein LTR72_007062 [Exophiala xenobiotica]|nr:hypothetical protein LTR41_008884 [Exophiala xenobiotica]KAK5220440.1 hypothetical protein LTR72_007062 [Exophiala xenobiotica]KAK5290713.1 hypothetical protein LTR14_006220 [Exophiala xenobiotica]KAK5413402.1 hypothetical protein LTR06_004829 [Exophiala xenobiotica]KAK5497537.1 hypothetical protein LTR55_002029 [Exophiala xenobiotica]